MYIYFNKEGGINMPEMMFSSNSEEIRHYERQLLADGAEHTREELFSYVRSHSPNGSRFTEGMLSGATRDLVRNSNGKYISPARGKYQMVIQEAAMTNGENMKTLLIEALHHFRSELSTICTVDLIEVSGQDVMPLVTQAVEISRLLKDKIDIIRNL